MSIVSDSNGSRYTWSDDLTISRQHLRVHCILYEQDPIAKVAPLVYATDLSSNGTFLKRRNTKYTASQEHGILMGKNCTFLLDDGDELHMSDTVTLIYHAMIRVKEIEFTKIQERERNIFASRYLVTGRLLGEGGYGKVLLGVNQETQQQLACKLVKLDHMYKTRAAPNLRISSVRRDQSTSKQSKRWPTRIATCFREFDILKDLSHPNIITLEKVFWSHNTIYIFQELVTGGDLFSFLEYKGGRLNNIQAAVVIWQILKGVEHLHDRNIVHRDIKPDNILMTSLEDGARVVITDFGNARFLPAGNTADAKKTDKYQRMFSCVGTLEHTAPEIHGANRAIQAKEGYSKSVDMWSIGSVTATVLTGDVIFSDRAHPNYKKDPQSVIVSLAAICDLSVLDDPYHPLWRMVGNRPKHFIKRLLVLEEEGRMTASEALAHPWFTNESHAHDYGDLYKRSIQAWEPRPKSVDLVERIPKVQMNFFSHALNQDSVSTFFPPSLPNPTHNMLQRLTASQHWRANTPLPSIMEDYEQDLLASQVRASLFEINCIDPTSQQRENSNINSQGDQQIYSDRNQDKSYSENQGLAAFHFVNSFQQRDYSSSSSTSHLSFRNKVETGMFHCGNAFDDENLHHLDGSLKEILNDCSQQRHCIHTHRPLTFNEAEDSVVVQETPFAEDILLRGCSNHNGEPEDRYDQTDIPNGNQCYQVAEQRKHSVLVLETPSDVYEQYHRFADDDNSSYQDWFGYESTTKLIDAPGDAQREKRRRLSHDDRGIASHWS